MSTTTLLRPSFSKWQTIRAVTAAKPSKALSLRFSHLAQLAGVKLLIRYPSCLNTRRLIHCSPVLGKANSEQYTPIEPNLEELFNDNDTVVSNLTSESPLPGQVSKSAGRSSALTSYQDDFEALDTKMSPAPELPTESGVASTEAEFVSNIKKALRRSKRFEMITVPYDPTDRKKKSLLKEEARAKEIQKFVTRTQKVIATKQEHGETVELWRSHRLKMKRKFPEGWNPRRKLSPDAIEGIQTLHDQFPEEYSTPALAEKFGISPEAVKRILKSRWRQKSSDSEEMAERWTHRGMRVWSQMSAIGMNPPRKWEQMGIQRDYLQIGQRDAQEGMVRQREIADFRRSFLGANDERQQDAEKDPHKPRPISWRNFSSNLI